MARLFVSDVKSLIVWGRHRDQVADAVIEAYFCLENFVSLFVFKEA